MEEINDKEAAMLATLIYMPDIQSAWEDDVGSGTIKDLINNLEASIEKKPANETLAAEMNKAEFQDVMNQIKASEKLMSLTVENIENNDQTYFRAMTLKPPKTEDSQNNMNPIIVFRGTAGNYQWNDNLSATVSSLTPSQREAQKYVIKSGYEHLTVVGHSKGGNMAASMAYLLPEGMVDKVYSLDGQGASGLFLANIPLEKQKFAKERVLNINEYRDIVSQLLFKTGADKNTKFVNSGIDYVDTGYDNFMMRLFHAHKPNYFLTEHASYTNKAFTPAIVVQLSKFLDMNGIEKHQAIILLQSASKAVYGEENPDTRWDYSMWTAVYDAEKVYNRVNFKRKSAILDKLSKLYNIDFSYYNLVQEEDSFVVEGAILTCPYCDRTGSLEQVENRTALEQGKPKAAKTDCIPWKNICMEVAECSLRSYEMADMAAKCILDLSDNWILTDSSIKVDINGSGNEVEAVLKKSILGCFKGGWMEVVHNGQLKEGDYQRKKVIPNLKQNITDITREKEAAEKTIRNMPAEVVEDAGTGIVQGVKDWYKDLVSDTADAWDAYVQDRINEALRWYVPN